MSDGDSDDYGDRYDDNHSLFINMLSLDDVRAVRVESSAAASEQSKRRQPLRSEEICAKIAARPFADHELVVKDSELNEKRIPVHR
eukprot:580856-Prymnesium_polylepis.1